MLFNYNFFIHIFFKNRWLTRPVTLLILKSVVSGAQTTLYAALDPDLINVTGKYFKDCEEHSVASAAEDDEMADWLWNISEELTGLKAMRVITISSFR